MAGAEDAAQESRTVRGQRQFLKMADWEKTQNPKRPKVPPWIKLHRAWLNLPWYRDLSAANRGVLFSIHMLCAELGNRVPSDISFVAQKIGLRPAVVGKAIRHLVATEFLLEFAEELDASQNRDLDVIAESERVPTEGESDKDKETENNPQGVKQRKTYRFTQPKFEDLTQTCVQAGVRGSDYEHISKVLKNSHGFIPSPAQLQILEQQIIDRRKE